MLKLQLVTEYHRVSKNFDILSFPFCVENLHSSIEYIKSL